MDQFNEYKAKKEGVITPKILIENLLDVIKDGDIESVAFVARQIDGTISAGWTDMTHTEAIGMLEVAKLQVIKDMWNDLEL